MRPFRRELSETPLPHGIPGRAFAIILASVLVATGSASAQDEPFNPFAPGAGDSPPSGDTVTRPAPSFSTETPAAAAASIPESKLTLLSEVSSVAPGQPFTVVFRLEHPKTWHSYYVNPGSVGLVFDPFWELPEGFTAERVGWPTPHITQTGGLNTYSYEGTVHHLFTITPPADLAAGSEVTLKASPQWQICDEVNCVGEPPFDAPLDLQLTLPVADGEAESDPSTVSDFAAARASLPADLPAEWSVQAFQGSGEVSLMISPASAVVEGEKLYFFGDDGQLDPQAEPRIERTEDGVRWTLARKAESGAPVLDEVRGILVIGDQGYRIEQVLERAPRPPVGIGTLLKIFGGMFLGGMILNLMPCVFPVIGLKIMGFVQQAGEDRRKIILHGVLFALGVLLSFWVLAGFLLGLREGVLGDGGGGEISWGYQLQNPWMVLGLMLIMFVLAMSMYGVFEIGVSATGVGGGLAQKQGALGTFFSGVLATIVATPCSAPFLGAALGATFGLPPLTFMLGFTAMALGLAFPYLLLSIFPQLVEKLPRPGAWMESFKQAMAFLLFATAGYLLWVYISQVGLDAMRNIVIGLTSLAVAAWIYGRWCTMSRKPRTRAIGFAFVILFAVVGFLGCRPPSEKSLVWEKWSQETVERALEDGRPVFVDFTAAWCLTCQQNKAVAYDEEVQALFEKYNVLALKADKTSPNPEIDAAIRELGRAAVPVNVLFVPGGEEPILTKELFGSSYMVEFLNEHLADLAGRDVASVGGE